MKNKPTNNTWVWRFALAGLSLVGGAAFGQNSESLGNGIAETTPAEGAAPSQNRLPITVMMGGSEQFKTDIDKNNAGSFSITRAKIGVAMPVQFNDKFLLGTSVRYGLDAYDFNDVPAGTTTWKNINTISAGSVLNWRANETWSYYVGGLVKMSAESGVALNQATTGGGIVGFSYKVSDTLALGAGLAVMSRLEDSVTALPVITAKWKFADNWLLDVGMSDMTTSGYGADVKWLFSKKWDFSFGAQFHQSRFRIDGNNGNGTQNGVATEEAATLYVDSTWHACSAVDLGAFVGVATNGKLKLADSSGNNEQDVNYKPAAVLGVKASLRF